MSSVQDHTPVVQEPSERREPVTQPNPPEAQPRVPQTRVPSDPTRVITSDAPREYSPPRVSQLLEPPPEGSDSRRPRRGVSTGTNSVTLLNHPGTIGNPNNDTGPQHPSMIQERSQNLSTVRSNQRSPTLYDTIRGDPVVRTQLSDDGEYGRGFSMRRSDVPRPLPVFSPSQDGNGVQNRSRGGFMGLCVGDFHSDPLEPQEETVPGTVNHRLRPTLLAAIKERDKYKKKARTQGLLINGAIALQVLVGAVTTGVAAGSKNIGAAVAVLGGMSTALASYLAKARGSGEPEFSNLRSRELSTFIREVQAFLLDKGHLTASGSEIDYQIGMYRERFELILKTEGENSTSGTRYATNSRGYHPGPGQQHMNGGGQYQAMPPQASEGTVQLSEKQQMLKDEKKLSGIV